MEILFTAAIWLVLCLLIASAGSKRKIGWGLSFAASLFLSPLVGLALVLLSDKKANGPQRWKQYEEDAKRAELKGNTKEAVEGYCDAIYYLENDYPNLSTREQEMREKALERLRAERERLQAQVG